MKCDHIEDEQWLDYSGEPRRCYPAEKVDEVIAELKARIAELEKLNHDLCERVTENDDIRLHWEEIEQTRAENESLKAIRKVHLEAIASMGAGLQQDGEKIRRLRRALWLARAKSAENAVTTWCRECMERWNSVERKCLKKAEVYK